MTKIALVGDYDAAVTAHRAIPVALRLTGRAIDFEWVPTESIASAERVCGFDGLWCVPASPYRSQAGALTAIRYARETLVPFLGSCGGFQHAIVEYARNALGWSDAMHAEETPAGEGRAVISKLQCALVEVRDRVRLTAGSRIAAAYGRDDVDEAFHCRYGVARDFASLLLQGPLRATGHAVDGEVRAVELDAHPFFVATLFQPERAALAGRPAPLVDAFVAACQSRA